MSHPTESHILASIRLAVGSRMPIWRNEVGVAKHAGRTVRYGLCRGSSDLIGIAPLVVTPEHVGQTLGVFTAIEVKTPTGRPTPEQLLFIELVQRNGGFAGVATSPDEAFSVLTP